MEQMQRRNELEKMIEWEAYPEAENQDMELEESETLFIVEEIEAI